MDAPVRTPEPTKPLAVLTPSGSLSSSRVHRLASPTWRNLKASGGEDQQTPGMKLRCQLLTWTAGFFDAVGWPPTTTADVGAGTGQPTESEAGTQNYNSEEGCNELTLELCHAEQEAIEIGVERPSSKALIATSRFIESLRRLRLIQGTGHRVAPAGCGDLCIWLDGGENRAMKVFFHSDGGASCITEQGDEDDQTFDYASEQAAVLPDRWMRKRLRGWITNRRRETWRAGRAA